MKEFQQLVGWYREPLIRYGDIAGRADRREYWTFTTVNAVVGWALGWADRVLGLGYLENLSFGVLGGLFGLVVAVPGIAVAIRRLHDTGRRGTWLFLLLVPVLGPLVLLVLLLVRGHEGVNSYGSPPRGGTGGEAGARSDAVPVPNRKDPGPTGASPLSPGACCPGCGRPFAGPDRYCGGCGRSRPEA